MIKNIINQIKLYFLFKYFKKNKSLPKEIQIGKINSYFLVNFIENKISNNEFLNGNIYTGMSEDNCLAWLKAISELIERRAFLENKIISIERFSRASDGCAAFPTILIGKEIAKKRARKNAINEALERYVWGK